MQMEEAKEVVKIAANFLVEQEPSATATRLEQIEERAGAGEWSIVLSFPDKETVANMLGNRIYKEVVVSSDTKEVKALRFWK